MAVRIRFGALMVASAVALAGCGGGSDDDVVGAPRTEPAKSTGSWGDAPGKVQFYNYLLDRGQEVSVDLYWFGEELVDGYKQVQHAEKFATLAYGEHTDVIPSRHFGAAGAPPEKLEYLAVPVGTQVAEQAETPGVLGGTEPFLRTDLYNSNSDPTTAYLNDGGTVVVFLSPATHGSTDAQPRVQSFYASLYPDGEVNFPESEVPKAGSGEVVLPTGFLFGTESRTEGGRLADLMGWRWSADGECLPEEGSHSYGGDGADWTWVVPDTAKVTIHPDFGLSNCDQPAWQEPTSLDGMTRPFGLIVPTAAGEPRMEIIEIP